MLLTSLHSVAYQWGLANYRSIRYGGVIVSNEICLTIRRSNWARLSLQFTLSRRCVALWWIMAPVWLTTVMSIPSVEPLQPWRPPPAKRTAPAHICSNPRQCLIWPLNIFWRSFINPVCFAAKNPCGYTKRLSEIAKYLMRLWKDSWPFLACSARFRFWKLKKVCTYERPRSHGDKQWEWTIPRSRLMAVMCS